MIGSRTLTRRLVQDAKARSITSSVPRAPAPLNTLTRQPYPTPSPSPTCTYNAFLPRTYATRSTGTQTTPATIAKKSLAASTTTTTTKAKAKPKPKPKTATKPKKKSAAKPKPKKKTTITAKKAKKPKKTTAAKKKPTPRAKKPVTQLQQQLTKVKQLKSIALLDEPKNKPTTVWSLIFSETAPGETNSEKGAQLAKTKSQRYKVLSATEREEYQTTANNNKTHNARTHTTWLEKYTPDTVRLANNARRQLSRIAIQPLPAGRKHHLTRAYHRLKDVRILKKPQSAYSQFIVERYASGDFQGATIAKSAGQLRDEWKALGEGEKQRYHDVYDKARETYDVQVLELFPTMKRKVPTGRRAATTSTGTGA